ncbi:hypothetical protein EJ03DRAFT_175453 [Teratosphaeria nubilosa]|uniref:Rhodopsin domain-containing protein n=1 Tax=Teratosphaeria nubilosa TaxID=161662 RepID=A0A6G1L159_9PEZI|nr:hypothetical protein EJ03DRAFT_175453 [Teratosphaeria nubilosa]
MPYPTKLGFAGRKGVSSAEKILVTLAFEHTVVVLCLVIRLSMRWPWRKRLARDDIFALAAKTFAVCNAIALIVGVQHGLGRDASELSNKHISDVRTSILAATLAFVLAATFALLSTVHVLCRIPVKRRDRLVLKILSICTIAWGVAGLIVGGVFLSRRNTPGNQYSAFFALGVLDVLLQIAAFVAAVVVTLPLQSKKQQARVLLSLSPVVLYDQSVQERPPCALFQNISSPSRNPMPAS